MVERTCIQSICHSTTSTQAQCFELVQCVVVVFFILQISCIQKNNDQRSESAQSIVPHNKRHIIRVLFYKHCKEVANADRGSFSNLFLSINTRSWQEHWTCPLGLCSLFANYMNINYESELYRLFPSHKRLRAHLIGAFSLIDKPLGRSYILSTVVSEVKSDSGSKEKQIEENTFTCAHKHLQDRK